MVVVIFKVGGEEILIKVADFIDDAIIEHKAREVDGLVYAVYGLEGVEKPERILLVDVIG